MRKLILVCSFLLASILSYSQNGLECLIVEKYYISNAADSIGSIGALPVGSVTYRIYADLLPGYKFQAVYGIGTHPMTITTSTAFFNNEDYGGTEPTYSKTNARKNSVMLDSWFSVGAGCAGNFGVLKTEDTTAGGATVVNNTTPTPILQNNDPAAGFPLTVKDGLWTGLPEAVTFVGLGGPTDPDSIFGAYSNIGNSMVTSNGSWASLNGSTGITASNMILIGQFTTNGVFHYELNVQIGTPTGGVEKYVASNPTGSEIMLPCMVGTYGASNQNPIINITSPTNGASFLTGANVTIDANASDPDGTIDTVRFYVDGNLIGFDVTSPYSAVYTNAVTGTHSLTAKAIDNLGGETISAAISITVNNNPPPVVNITAPSNGATFITGAVVAVNATATDNGSVASVQFFVDGTTSLGIDNAFPYTVNYTTTAGSHTLTALATDNLGAQTTSAAINITVGSNIPPTVSITAPANGALYTAPAIVNITADALDPDGNITLVEFLVNGVVVGTDATSPYSYNWTSVIGTANITARATDNLGAITTSSAVLLSIANPNIPYKLVTSNNICVPTSFCVPLVAIDTVQNVIGYDMVLNFNNAKVQPTGVITVSNSLINPSYVDVADTIDIPNGKINISLFFNSSAPANTVFNGLGNLICIEFTKTAGFNPVDSAVFSISFLQESYFPGVGTKTVDPGKYITYKDTAFAGVLKFWQNNAPLGYNSANPSQFKVTNIFGNNGSCTNKSVNATQPNINGQFNYSTTNGVDVDIERDIAGNTSVQPVVNGFDALLAQRITIGVSSFLPSVYQVIAADVNEDGTVSAGDVSQINQRAVLMIPEFKQAWNYNAQGVSNGQLSKDWIFIDSVTVANNPAYHISSTYPSDNGTGFSAARVPVVPFCLPVPGATQPNCPVISNSSFRGVMIGDINGNFATVGSGGLFKVEDIGTISLDLPNAVQNNGYIDIPVEIASSNTINSLDLSMKYDESILKFESIEGIANNIRRMTNFNDEDRILRFTSYSQQEYEKGTSILYLRFKLLGSSFTGEEISSVNGYLNGDEAAVEMKKSATPADLKDYWIRLYPNPASSILNIELSEGANIQLYDAQGRIVLERIVNADELTEINTQQLPSGVYILKAINNKFSIVKNVIVNE